MANVEQDVVFAKTTRDEIRAELDVLSRDAFGLSGDDFVQQWTDGGLDPFDPTVARLAVFARLLRV